MQKLQEAVDYWTAFMRHCRRNLKQNPAHGRGETAGCRAGVEEGQDGEEAGGMNGKTIAIAIGIVGMAYAGIVLWVVL